MICGNRETSELAGTGWRWVGGVMGPRDGALRTYPLEDVLGSVLLMPVLAGFRSYARCP